tara:strand:+ start:8731 stop:9435 length:705 start_codon:yes stop_codon:yes gene_type:complete
MTSYKFLQYNTDNLRLGWDALVKASNNVDFLLLQRFPRDKYKELCNITGKAFLTESINPDGWCLAIGRTDGMSSISGIETIQLPSTQLIHAIGDPWQGCNVLKGTYNNINLVSALPCFPASLGEFPVTKADNELDIEHILATFQDAPTIIAGDFHFSPSDMKINELLEKYNFKSYLDGHKTFKNPMSHMINLDKLVCNFEIEVSDIVVHADKMDSIEQGHFPITYTVTWDSKKD